LHPIGASGVRACLMLCLGVRGGPASRSEVPRKPGHRHETAMMNSGSRWVDIGQAIVVTRFENEGHVAENVEGETASTVKAYLGASDVVRRIDGSGFSRRAVVSVHVSIEGNSQAGPTQQERMEKVEIESPSNENWNLEVIGLERFVRQRAIDCRGDLYPSL